MDDSETFTQKAIHWNLIHLDDEILVATRLCKKSIELADWPVARLRHMKDFTRLLERLAEDAKRTLANLQTEVDGIVPGTAKTIPFQLCRFSGLNRDIRKSDVWAKLKEFVEPSLSLYFDTLVQFDVVKAAADTHSMTIVEPATADQIKRTQLLCLFEREHKALVDMCAKECRCEDDCVLRRVLLILKICNCQLVRLIGDHASYSNRSLHVGILQSLFSGGNGVLLELPEKLRHWRDAVGTLIPRFIVVHGATYSTEMTYRKRFTHSFFEESGHHVDKLDI